jgi:acetyl esterase/lipase
VAAKENEMTAREIRYGPHRSQVGDLYLSHGRPRAVVCLLHGGVWREPYDRDQLTKLSEALSEDGFAVLNLEYRRLGEDGGWPATFDDVTAGISHLAKLPGEGYALPLDKVVVAGHSAGGQLALWAGAQKAFGSVKLYAVAALAPVADLRAAYNLSLGVALHGLLGGSPEDVPERYAAADPMQLKPQIRQLIVQGAADNVVPPSMNRAYAAAVGELATFVDVPDCGHFEFLNPDSPATAVFRQWLTTI